jgi:hypothetical protein
VRKIQKPLWNGHFLKFRRGANPPKNAEQSMKIREEWWKTGGIFTENCTRLTDVRQSCSDLKV